MKELLPNETYSAKNIQTKLLFAISLDDEGCIIVQVTFLNVFARVGGEGCRSICRSKLTNTCTHEWTADWKQCAVHCFDPCFIIAFFRLICLIIEVTMMEPFSMAYHWGIFSSTSCWMCKRSIIVTANKHRRPYTSSWINRKYTFEGC